MREKNKYRIRIRIRIKGKDVKINTTKFTIITLWTRRPSGNARTPLLFTVARGPFGAEGTVIGAFPTDGAGMRTGEECWPVRRRTSSGKLPLACLLFSPLEEDDDGVEVKGIGGLSARLERDVRGLGVATGNTVSRGGKR